LLAVHNGDVTRKKNAYDFITNLKQLLPGLYLEFNRIVTEDLRNMKGCDRE
jgi:hypothetical protein